MFQWNQGDGEGVVSNGVERGKQCEAARQAES